MNKPKKALSRAMAQMRGWSWLKRTYAAIFALGFIISSFLFLTPTGEASREWMAQTVITTQHRSWAWMFVGGEKRDRMGAQLHLDRELMGTERQNFGMINVGNGHKTVKRSADELIKVEDISAPLWKGKKMYVYDPRAIRVVVPSKSGEGERISSMVERTGAYAGINGGGFVDPDGLGNGFAPIGFIISGGEILYTDQDGSIAQHVVGFTKEGVLVVGKYTIDQLLEMGISEAVMFYPRVIANGKGLITSGDGGWGRGPRTAIGQKEDGTVVIMVIDGRQTHSVGATLKEIQDLMLEEGVVNAGFLDGGASSELVTQADGLITKPSSRYGERRLPSALLVFGDPADYVPNNPWDGVTNIDPGGAYDHPDFLKEQAENKNKPKPPSPLPRQRRQHRSLIKAWSPVPRHPANRLRRIPPAHPEQASLRAAHPQAAAKAARLLLRQILPEQARAAAAQAPAPVQAREQAATPPRPERAPVRRRSRPLRREPGQGRRCSLL